MRKFLLLSFMLMLAFSYGESWAQERTVSGKVSSVEDGSSLPGVNVVLKGTTTGTVTDVEGNYTLAVPSSGGTLVFSFIGLASEEVEVGSRSVIDVQMSADVKQLSEVVVTAFGQEREKKALGYSVQDLSGENITKARETNIVNSLSGKIAGVQVTNTSGSPGSSSRIVLRGATSLTGDNQPLFVVDGIPINNQNFGTATPNGGVDLPNGAADINPDDVESVSVLKGANAAALYGSRAANGVILITTKTGKQTKGIGVAINSSVTFQNPLKLPDYQNSYGGGYDDKTYRWVDGTVGNGGQDESWGPALDQGFNFQQWQDYNADGTYDSPSPWVSHPDNVRDFFETGTIVSNNVALSAGGEKANFRLSLTNMQQDGMIYNTGLERNTIAINAGAQLSDKLSVETSINYIKSESDNIPGGGYDQDNPMMQFTWFQRQVDIGALKDYNNLPSAPAETAAEGTPINWNTNFNNNPYWLLDNNTQGFDKNRVIGNVRLMYQFTDEFSAMVRMGGDFFTDLQQIKRAKNSNEAPNGSYQEYDRTYYEYNTDFLLTYDKQINETFGLAVSAGGNLRREDKSRNMLFAEELEIPGTFTIENASVPIQATNFDSNKEVQSLYGTAQLRFLNALFLDVTARNDWSSTLPADNNSYFYPSVSVSGVLTDLVDIQSDVLTFAKLRASWAQVGADTDPYNLQDVFSFRDKWNGSTLEATVNGLLKNPGLKPEITTSIEVGADLKFFNNRLGMDLTYYDSKSEDLIVEIDISGASGWTSLVGNVGEMTNKGVELQLYGTPIQTNDFQWDVRVNYAKNKNEVVSLGGVDNLRLGGEWNVDVIATPGEPYPALFGPDYLRDPDGNIIHSDGIPQKDPTSQVLGNVAPDWTGGISTSLTYKGISLGATVDAKIGGDIYTMTSAWGRYSGIMEETLKGRELGIVGDGVMNVGSEENPNYVPNDVVVSSIEYNHNAFGNSIGAGSVFDASYVKFREFTLGYSFPRSLIENTPFQSVSISFVGRNLAILYSKAPHIDPEAAFTNSNAQGIEHAQLPSARNLGFNVNLKF